LRKETKKDIPTKQADPKGVKTSNCPSGRGADLKFRGKEVNGRGKKQKLQHNEGAPAS